MVPKEWQNKRSKEELDKMKARWYIDIREFGGSDKCTCDECADKEICARAYDLYNSQDDCLLEK